MTIQTSLFNAYNLESFLNLKLTNVPRDVLAVPESEFRAASINSVVSDVETDVRVHRLVTNETDARLKITETLDGNCVTIILPFTGDPGLWDLTPSQHPSYHPMGYVMDFKELHIDFVLRDGKTIPDAKEYFNNELDRINIYLKLQCYDLEQFEVKLLTLIELHVKIRKERLEQQKLIKKLLLK